MIFITNVDFKKKEDIEEIEEVKEYFERIYTILNQEIRDKLEKLEISEQKKKSIIKELAFLSQKKQIKYLGELYRIYQRIVDEL